MKLDVAPLSMRVWITMPLVLEFFCTDAERVIALLERLFIRTGRRERGRDTVVVFDLIKNPH